jgi:hypothetical protein
MVDSLQSKHVITDKDNSLHSRYYGVFFPSSRAKRLIKEMWEVIRSLKRLRKEADYDEFKNKNGAPPVALIEKEAVRHLNSELVN